MANGSDRNDAKPVAKPEGWTRVIKPAFYAILIVVFIWSIYKKEDPSAPLPVRKDATADTAKTAVDAQGEVSDDASNSRD